MEVYAIIEVSYDYHAFEVLRDIGSNLEILKSDYNDVPLFSFEEVEHPDFEPPKDDGLSHRYYQVFNVEVSK